MLSTKDDLSEGEFALVKKAGPDDFDLSGTYHSRMRPDPTIPDLYIMPVRTGGKWKAFLQWVYLLHEVVRHGFDPPSALPQTGVSGNTTVSNKQMPYDLAYQICQYIAISLWAKAPSMAPIPEAFAKIQPGMILPPTALTNAAQENPFVFAHIGRISRSENHIASLEDEDEELAAPYERFREINYNQF